MIKPTYQAATDEDVEDALRLAKILLSIQHGVMPDPMDGVPLATEWAFDEENYKHLRYVYSQLEIIARRSSLSRLVMAYKVLRSACTDTTNDTLAYSPKIESALSAMEAAASTTSNTKT